MIPSPIQRYSHTSQRIIRLPARHTATTVLETACRIAPYHFGFACVDNNMMVGASCTGRRCREGCSQRTQVIGSDAKELCRSRHFRLFLFDLLCSGAKKAEEWIHNATCGGFCAWKKYAKGNHRHCSWVFTTSRDSLPRVMNFSSVG